jgi:hypothetical protein
MGNSTKTQELEENKTEVLEMKSSVSQMKNTVGSCTSRLDEMKDRTAWLEDTADELQKSDENKEKRKCMSRTCKKMYELGCHFFQKTKPTIIGIKEGEVQAKGTKNTFNNLKADNFPNLEKAVILAKEAFSTPDKTRTEPPHIIL